ncbi:MAG: DUF2147 domain-containing protein [Burkholderiaceae bacterium]|jgi:uncharacterized protein (DUF2147 family)|nr:DUF2147 domain-containing protein [Burkholderiaceae bacterium]
MKLFMVACILAVLVGGAYAQKSPVGLWRSIDDKTGQAKADIRIEERSGVLFGRIEKTLRKDAASTCERCTDDRKGAPMVGLEIIRDVHPAQNDPDVWEGGQILDPENGKEYRTRLTLIDGGGKLQVRGYLGPFWRTQTWVRLQ